jgi:thioesterase domain-containing protein
MKNVDCVEGQVEAETEAIVNHVKGNARLLQLKPGHRGPCFFLVPGTGGRVEGFANLATLLEIPMPVFAIEARGVDRLSAPDDDIEEMVEHYVNRIQTVQPSGPYFFLGHSFGGMVVFEMARRLINIGETISCLILLDTYLPKKYWPFRFYIDNVKSRVRGHLARFATLSLKDNFTYYSRRMIRRAYGLQHIPVEMKIGSDIARVVMANDMIGKKWRPQFYPGKITLFCSTDVTDLENVWRSRTHELEVHAAAGGHINLIEWPYVSSLATDISTCLMKAWETTTSSRSNPLE